MPTVVPGQYRGVAVATVEVALTAAALRAWFVGREAYRRTRWIVVHGADGGTAVLAVRKASEEPLFSPITDVELLAGPEETAFVVAPEVDTAVPSALARVAVERAPGQRAVVVRGRYEHVSFVLDPAPLSVCVVDVVPPHPAKLHDQAARVLELAEDLPPLILEPVLVDLEELVRSAPAQDLLLPCRGSGVTVEGARLAFLDERPPRVDGWHLIGCARSQELHTWCYGAPAPRTELCPRVLAGRRVAEGTPVLTKCCLLEEGFEREGATVVVPWGATLAQVREGLAALAEQVAWAHV